MQDRLWPHQNYALAEIATQALAGRRALCVTTPTGGGKTRVISKLILEYAGHGWPAVLYTNRRLLIDQLGTRLDEAGITYGVRAAGHADERDALVQLSSLPTEASRTLDKGKWTIHGHANPDSLAIVDEAHLNNGETGREIIKRHRDAGHLVVGFTATPGGLDGTYEHLIVAGRMSELRACGALVRADFFGPDEPDYRVWKRGRVDDDCDGEDPEPESQLEKMGGRNALFGRVFEWFRRINHEQRPTILFAPGVPESLWFAQEFTRRGIPAAHLDGQSVWTPEGHERTSREARAEVLEKSRLGEIAVLCNRFVLREGIDAPWISHGILATVFGNENTYLQSVGRLLRAAPGKDRATVQDHGGNWHRHLSPNVDRLWTLDYNPALAAAIRADQYREKVAREPARCPNCAQILLVRVCPTCGREIDFKRKCRPVAQSDGSLVELHGDVYRPRARRSKPDTLSKWKQCYFAARNSKRGMTFKQAEGLFWANNGYFPPRDLKLMPKEPHDWFRPVSQVDPGDLL